MAQAYLTVADFKTAFPEFSAAGLTDAQIEFVLDAAALQVNLECWINKASFGHGYLTAHGLAIDKLTVEYNLAAPTVDLASTNYGRLFLQLQKTLMRIPVAARTVLPTPPIILGSS